MAQDENLVRAENEDKVTPYLVFLIAVVRRHSLTLRDVDLLD